MPKERTALVLGAGMVGSAMAMDLARQGFAVTVADASSEALERVRSRYGVAVAQGDLSHAAALGRLVAPFDVVVGALASHLGLATLRTVIEAGKPYCDISFMAEDALSLDELARQRGVTAIVDAGVAPGMSNLLAGHAVQRLDACERLVIYVGGLPAVRTWPYWYKAPFSPADVLEEYTRPARIVEHGKIVVRPALSELEQIEFPGVGTLEAFNTDGLRSLAYTLRVPFMVEKTMRWPGHVELMRALRETGLFSKDELVVKGQRIRPLDVTAALLFPRWTFDEREPDLTVLRVTAEGRRAGRDVRLEWNLLDRYDAATDLRSMSRTTAFPATILAARLATGALRRPGVNPPEKLADEPGLVDHVLSELEARGVAFQFRES
jgi:lysine 6-dehydrogenase